jgi:hypothetical protein
MKAMASLSLDLDNLWSYRKIHGDPGWEDYPSYLDVLVPRVLEFLAVRRLTITFFIVGQDAAMAANAGPLAAIAAAGHEIGNHSFRHEPWLHRYDDQEIDEEITNAELAIERATGVRPVGFRGPGYSLSPAVLRVLAHRGYMYDASTFPTVVGPLARAWYFRSASLTPPQRAERSLLFGRFRDGLQPLRAHQLQVGERFITEVPVTALPLLRLPMHISYLLTLAGASPLAARRYCALALRLCRLRRLEPSLLLHPLDFLDADEAPGLSFFPGMSMPLPQKLATVGHFIDQLARHYRVTTVRDHAERFARSGRLRSGVSV